MNAKMHEKKNLILHRGPNLQGSTNISQLFKSVNSELMYMKLNNRTNEWLHYSSII